MRIEMLSAEITEIIPGDPGCCIVKDQRGFKHAFYNGDSNEIPVHKQIIGLNGTLELEKKLSYEQLLFNIGNVYCECTPDETTGWMIEAGSPICNICGKVTIECTGACCIVDGPARYRTMTVNSLASTTGNIAKGNDGLDRNSHAVKERYGGPEDEALCGASLRDGEFWMERITNLSCPYCEERLREAGLWDTNK
jgi:hypothetical protein